MDTLLKLLQVFFDSPAEEQNIRESSIKSGLAYGTCYNYLHKLTEERLLLSRRVGKAIVFVPNLKNSELLKYFEILELHRTKSFFEKHKGEYLMLTRILQGLAGMELAAIFGSFAREEHVPDSDIDLLLIGNKSRFEKQVINRCKDFGITKRKTVSLVFASAKQFEEGITKKEGFYKNLWKDRILLKGEYLWWQIISKHGVPNES